MKQQTFPVSVSKKTKGMLPAFIYGFIAAAAVIALPFIPLVAKNVSPLTQLIDAIKDLQNTNSDPTKYLSILKLVFPIMTLILSLVTLIRLIVWLCNVGKGQVGALRMTGTYFSVISILVSYLTYLLFFTSLLNLSSEVKKELYESFKYLTVSEYGKYYIAYGAIAGVGLLVSAIGNWTSSLTRPNAGMTVYKAIRFIGAAVVLVMVLYLPIVSVSYGSGKTSLMKLLASGNKDAMFVISNSGMECNAEKIEQIGGFIKNAFTGGGDDVTPTLLAIFYVNFVPFILLIAAFSATLKTLRALVQPSEEVLYDCRANNGDELDSTNYKRLKKPKKLGVGVSVFAFIAATFLLGAGFGFGPVATIMKLTSYSNLKVVLAPVLTVYLFVYGIALIVYVSVYNTQLDARLAAENAAQVKSEEQSQANEETVATAAEETTEAPALIAPVAETTSEATAAPAEEATAPAEEQPAEITEETAAPAEEATAPAEEQPAEAADEPTEEVKAEEAEGAEVTAPAAEEVAPETQEAVEEPAEEDTAADVEETAVPEAEEKEVVTEPQAKVEETPTIAEEPAAPVQEKAEEKSLSNYERVEKEYEAYIAESNDMLRKYYKRIKELRAAAEEDNLDVAERTTREAEYERALERKRSYVYESGLIIKGYKSRLASIKELDEE